MVYAVSAPDLSFPDLKKEPDEYIYTSAATESPNPLSVALGPDKPFTFSLVSLKARQSPLANVSLGQ